MLYVFLALALLSGCALTYAASGFASLAAVWQVPVFFLGSFLALVVLFLLVVLVSCLFVDPKKLLEKPSGYFRFLLNEFCRIALALGGALGNLYDRVVLGYVIDMLDFCLIHFAVFNVADACVNIGIVLLAIWMVFFEEKDKQHAVYRWGAPKAAAQTEGGNHDPSDSKEKNEDADTAPDCR